MRRQTRAAQREELVEAVLKADERAETIEDLEARHAAEPMSLEEMKLSLLELMP